MEEKSVGQYKLVERLGAGGMGEVYRAQDQRLNRTVAVKLLSTTDEARRRRFWQEAQAASALNHPNIITVHDMVTSDDAEYLVMEYVQGETLAQKIRPGGMPVGELLAVATQMADALATAHAAGIVHRDIKPANVMVSPSGLVKVLDFGLAKLALPGASAPAADSATLTVAPAPLTVAGSILGTVSYMSPEQAEGQVVDARSDIFSFGAVLYEMATGTMAFQGQSLVSTLTAILRDEPKPIPDLAPAMPPELIEVIQRALRKRPEERWQSMTEVHAELKRLRQLSDSRQLDSAQRPPGHAAVAAPAHVTAAKPEIRKGLPAWIPAVGVFGVFMAGVFWWSQRDTTVPDTPRSEKTEQAIPPPVPTAKPAETALNNQSVVEMVRAKVPPAVIISHVRSAPSTDFDTSTQGLIELGKAGVPEPVIREMSARWRQAPTARPEAAASAAGRPAVETPAPNANPTTPSPNATTVQLADGRPIEIELAEDIAADAEPGTPLRFTVKTSLQVAGMTIVPAGAAVSGEIAEAGKRRFPGMGSKMTYRLSEVTFGKTRLKVRANPADKANSRRPVETASGTRSKALAAAKGAVYLAYVDGDQAMTAQ